MVLAASLPCLRRCWRFRNCARRPGAATLRVSASSASVHVDFIRQFSDPPRVVVTGLDGLIGTEAFVETRIYNVTTLGFDVEWRSLSGNAATGSAGFGYEAFGE